MTMLIEFDEVTCVKIIDRVGLTPLPGAAQLFTRTLNDSAQMLANELQKSPFPDRAKVRQRVESLRKPLRDFIKYYGLEISTLTGKVSKIEHSKWGNIIDSFSAYPHHTKPAEIEGRMKKLAAQAHRLYNSIEDFQKYLEYNAGGAGMTGLKARKTATKLFIQELVSVAPKIFDAPLTISNASEVKGTEVRGTALTYLSASMEAIRQKLLDENLEHLANDPALRIPITTLYDWFYEFNN